jgi:hypothetical protein
MRGIQTHRLDEFIASFVRYEITDKNSGNIMPCVNRFFADPALERSEAMRLYREQIVERLTHFVRMDITRAEELRFGGREKAFRVFFNAVFLRLLEHDVIDPWW